MDAIRAIVPAVPPSRWQFGSAVFDEAAWTLTVDGSRVRVELKPLEILLELLRRDGAVATKSDLLDAVWPDVAVVEASLPTAVAKLRRALGDDGHGWPIIETVARVGYRLSVPVERLPPRALPDRPARSLPTRLRERFEFRMIGGSLFAVAGAVALMLATYHRPRGDVAAPPVAVTDKEVRSAARRLDLPRIDALLARGWNPNTPYGAQRNTILTTALETCEWNPGREQQLLLIVRTLLDGGAKPDIRNYWGDTAYSIAAAPRYCGPDHPATRLMRLWCDDGEGGVREACRARYVHRGEPPPPPGD